MAIPSLPSNPSNPSGPSEPEGNSKFFQRTLEGLLDDNKDKDSANFTPFPIDNPTPLGKMGQFQLLECIGKGGMGEVWKAKDPFGNIAAIKILRSGSHSLGRIQRFKKEASAMTRLQHRGICRIQEIGENRGPTGAVTYIAMEYVEGVSLADLLEFAAMTSQTSLGPKSLHSDITVMVKEAEKFRREISGHSGHSLSSLSKGGEPAMHRFSGKVALGIQQSLALILKVCEAMQYAHEHGIFHRDLKPDNIMVREDGEPLILDFGLAKFRQDDEKASLSVSGDIFGTLEFMAPEQALSSKNVNERADVFGIGATLYLMLTGHKHFQATGNILEDIQCLQDHEPVRPRLLNRQIDSDLDLVLLKALRPDSAHRYASARQLHEDLKRYLDGEPVLAKKPTLLYRLSKKFGRHKTVAYYSAALAVLLLSFGFYLLYDYNRQWGSWVKAYHLDFSQPRPWKEDFRFMNNVISDTVTPWQLSPDGLKMKPLEWAWLQSVKIHGDVRLVCRIKTGSDMEGLEACISCNEGPVTIKWDVPPGYSFQFGGYNGTLDFLSLNGTSSVPDVSVPQSSAFLKNKVFVLAFERQGETISMKVDGNLIAEELDLLPHQGEAFSSIGLRSFSGTMEILSLDVYRKALPEKASPIVAGDAMIEAGRPKKALDKYRTMARDYGTSQVGERALARAYLTASKIPGLPDSVKGNILKELRTHFPGSLSLARAMEIEAMDLLKNFRYQEAMDLLPGVFSIHPGTKIALKFQKHLKYTAIEPHLLREMTLWLSRTRDVTNLNLSSLALEDLEAFKHHSLKGLNIEYNAVTDLKPLQTMPLEMLDCSSNRIGSLEHLIGLPLVNLRCGHNAISSLEPLRAMKLNLLDCSENRIVDLEPLRGIPLNVLGCSENAITTLEPLRGMALNRLNIGNNLLSSLAPLQGMNLKYLAIPDNRIESLKDLEGIPLLELMADHNLIRDLEPLRNMPLEMLSITRNLLTDLEPLGKMKLKSLNISNNSIQSLAPLQGMPLERLSAIDANLDEKDLKFLRGLPLEILYLSRNRIGDLTPLQGMALSELLISGNRISRLDPLRRMPLKKVDLSNNQISSLEALRGMDLDVLQCAGNSLRSLEPFTRNPPRIFHYDCKTLGSQELKRVIGIWSKNPETAKHARQASILLAIQEERYRDLEAMATRKGDLAFQFVPKWVTWKEARKLARQAGGDLLIIPDPSTLGEVIAEVGKESSGTWIGLTKREGKYIWVNGKESIFFNFHSKQDRIDGKAGFLHSSGKWGTNSGESTNPFIIQWISPPTSAFKS